MLNHTRAAEIFDRIRRLCSADEIEVLFNSSQFALTRFANNTIHQNVAEENHIASIRTVFDGKTARATANQFDDDSLRRAVQASENLAKVQERDPDLLEMVTPKEAGQQSESPNRFFSETAAVSAGQRAHAVGEIVGIADANKLTTAGIYSISQSADGLFNSQGVSRWHTQTLAEVSITMLGETSSGWQKANSPDVRNMQARMLGEIAARKA